MVITRTLTAIPGDVLQGEPGRGRDFVEGDTRHHLSTADWIELGKPPRIIVQVTVPREPDDP